MVSDNQVNIALKVALLRQFGSQIRATRRLQIDETRLSKIIQGHREPTAQERKRFLTVLGADYFEPEGQRAEVG